MVFLHFFADLPLHISRTHRFLLFHRHLRDRRSRSRSHFAFKGRVVQAKESLFSPSLPRFESLHFRPTPFRKGPRQRV